jgi:hexosaminidase
MAVLHAAAGQPLTRYHIGADETPGAWSASPACAAYEATTGIKPADLGGHFIEKVSAMLAARGVVVAGWSDGMGHAQADRMPAKVHSNNWGALGGEGPASAHVQANQGWEVVISTPEVMYFDSPQAADPKERGYDWPSRATDTRKVFDFMPENLPAHAELWADLHGRPRPEGRLSAGARRPVRRPAGPAVERDDPLGRPGRLHAVSAPAGPGRAGLARRELGDALHAGQGLRSPRPAPSPPTCGPGATPTGPPSPTCWAGANWPGWTRRASPTASPTVGAVVENGRLKANVEFPGMPIEYRVEGGDLAALCRGRGGLRQGRGSGAFGRWSAGGAGRSVP